LNESQNVNKKEFVYIYYLRVIGMFLICWPHLTFIINPNWRGLKSVQTYINTPLRIGQNFGFLGVVLFFLIAGFLTFFNSMSIKNFIVKKIKTIVIPLWFSLLVFYLFNKFISVFFITYWTQFGILDWIKTATLYNFLAGKNEVIDGVLWFMVPLITFWAIYCPLRKIADKNIKLFECIFTIITILIYYFEPYTKQTMFFGIFEFFYYIVIIRIGFLLAAFFTKKLTLLEFTFSIICKYILIYFGLCRFNPNLLLQESGMVSITYGTLFFIILLLLTEKLKQNKTIKKLSDISYVFYIIHSLFGGLLVSALYNKFPYIICLILAIVFSLICAFGIEYLYGKIMLNFKCSLDFKKKRI